MITQWVVIGQGVVVGQGVIGQAGARAGCLGGGDRFLVAVPGARPPAQARQVRRAGGEVPRQGVVDVVVDQQAWPEVRQDRAQFVGDSRQFTGTMTAPIRAQA